MRVQFLGATQTVTGSRYLVTQGKTKVLVDCGLFQGLKALRLRNWAPLPVPVAELDAVLLTHAHLDHSGYIPLLKKSGFKGTIYCTPPTLDLCRILLPDSGYLQEEEAKFANKRGYSKHKPALPLYTVEDAKNSLSYFKSVPWYQTVSVSKGGLGTLSFQFHPAGHLLGAASVHVKTESQCIAFSGDLGRVSDPLIRPPSPHFACRDLVVESTYGDRQHPAEDPETVLQEMINKTYARGGILLIPSFAVGRAQLILYYLHQLRKKGSLPSVPIYLNSPMAAEVNRTFEKHADELKISPEELAQIGNGVRVVGSSEESVALNRSTNPAIIIAASGMATGGRVLHHLKTLLPFEKNSVLFVGFQAGGTRGDLLVRGAKEIKIHGELWPVQAEVFNMESLSAHTDAEETLAWIKALKGKPRRIFVTHGEPGAAAIFRERIEKELGISALVPEYLSEYELT